MIEELLLWLWLFLRVSGFVQQSRQLGPCKTVRFAAFATLNIATTHPVSQARLRRALEMLELKLIVMTTNCKYIDLKFRSLFLAQI